MKLRLLLLTCAILGLISSAFAAPTYVIDYSANIAAFAGYVTEMIGDNVAALFGLLALVVGFGFVWSHVRSLGRSV